MDGIRVSQAPEWAVEYPVIVSGHANGTVRFWKLLPKQLSKSRSTSGGFEERGAEEREDEKLALDLIFACKRSHEAAVTSISFSGDGHQMLTGDADGMVIKWGKDRKSAGNHGPKWLHRASRPDGRRVDHHLLRSLTVHHMRTERGEAEGSSKLITSDFGAPDVYVLVCRLAQATQMTFDNKTLNTTTAHSDTSSETKWETRRTFAQFAELQLLLQRHGGVATATLPPKKPNVFIPGHSEDQDGERERQEGLATFVTDCLGQCTIRQAAILCAFIQAPDALYDISHLQQ